MCRRVDSIRFLGRSRGRRDPSAVAYRRSTSAVQRTRVVLPDDNDVRGCAKTRRPGKDRSRRQRSTLPCRLHLERTWKSSFPATGATEPCRCRCPAGHEQRADTAMSWAIFIRSEQAIIKGAAAVHGQYKRKQSHTENLMTHPSYLNTKIDRAGQVRGG